MAYSSGNCPQCGVKLNSRESSIDTVRRCEACGFKFVARKAPFSLTGCLGNLFSLIGVSIFILLGCGAVGIFIVAMNLDWSSPPIADSTSAPTQEAVPVEPAVTPQEFQQPQSMPEPSPVVQQERAVDQKLSTAAAMRSWSDKTGKFSTDASFGGMGGGSVTLHKSDGTTIKIPLDQLSQADQDWIAARRKNPVTKSRP